VPRAPRFRKVPIGRSRCSNFAPPELPVYEQPICPGEGYILDAGLLGSGMDEDGDYYWVAGNVGIGAQEPGFLWTSRLLGLGWWRPLFSMKATGDPRVGFYGGGLTTATDTLATVMRADVGTGGRFYYKSGAVKQRKRDRNSQRI